MPITPAQTFSLSLSSSSTFLSSLGFSLLAPTFPPRSSPSSLSSPTFLSLSSFLCRIFVLCCIIVFCRTPALFPPLPASSWGFTPNSLPVQLPAARSNSMTRLRRNLVVRLCR
ncbi:hypothetical protein BD779DRAFT_1235662 [Infundibulicybe gibba]|nr:hypothetical protein BD779DRAFT_1235662 [Infundibulicybe gibba]